MLMRGGTPGRRISLAWRTPRSDLGAWDDLLLRIAAALIRGDRRPWSSHPHQQQVAVSAQGPGLERRLSVLPASADEAGLP